MEHIDKFKDEDGQIDSDRIKEIVPYDAPFLLVDKILNLDKKKVVAIKNITNDEEFLKGHLRGFPMMPFALIVEGMGQAGTIVVRYNIKDQEKKDVLAYWVINAESLRPVFPGCKVRYEVKYHFKLGKIALTTCKAFLKGKMFAKAMIMFAIVDKDRFRKKNKL